LILLAAAGRAQFPQEIRVSPVRLAAGSSDTTFTISGTGLTRGAQVYWNGQPRPTTFVNQRIVKVLISNFDLARAGFSRISLRNPDQGTPAPDAVNVLAYLPLRSVDLVYDPLRARIYASLSEKDANGPALAVIDPVKGLVERYVPLPLEPGVLAISRNSRYLYVALRDSATFMDNRIRRIDMGGAGAVLDIPVAESVTSILPLPGDGTSFIAALGNGNYSAVAFDGTTRRMNQSNRAPRCLAGVSGTALYGGPGFRLLRLDANGMPFAEEISIETLLGGPVCSVFARGLLYSSNGDVVDPNGPARKWKFGAWGLIDVDPERNRAYFVGFERRPPGLNLPKVSLMIFDTISHVRISSTVLPASLTSLVILGSGRLVHWGADGLAFGEYPDGATSVSNGVYLFHTSELN
jgi:hypothetical protein